MSGLLERVRAALADKYDVERQIGGGGMGVVYLGRHRALDRPVAIKVLRPDMATAVAGERFKREGRWLARVSHPAVVTVYDADEKNGLYYLTTELLGGTLADRLTEGQPIPADEVIRFGVQLLEGLAQVHACGIVHRDIKPSNIFIREDGGPKLGDFGIARQLDSRDEELTVQGESPGTPRYMSPEQRVTSQVTQASDIYAVGMVLYEMASGRLWPPLDDPDHANWDGISAPLVPVLRKALAWESQGRWRDARTFAAALRRLRHRSERRQKVAIAGGVVVVLAMTIAALIVLGRGQATDRHDIALVPITVTGGDPVVGRRLAFFVGNQLVTGFTDEGLQLTDTQSSVRWASDHVHGDALPSGAWDALGTNAIVLGNAVVSNDSIEVTGEVVKSDSSRLLWPEPIRGPLSELGGKVSCDIAFAILRTIHRDHNFSCQAGNVAAINAWAMGEDAFSRDNWLAAARFYQEAIAHDSSWARAWWSLFNVCRWGRFCGDDDVEAVRTHLREAYEQSPKHEHLSDLVQLLIGAEFVPTVPERLAKYDTAVRRFSYDPYPKLLLGNELFSRGPLVGVGLDSAIAVLNTTAVDDTNLSQVYEMLVWGNTRRGREREARSALRHYREIASTEQDSGLSLAAPLHLVITARFESDLAFWKELREGAASPQTSRSLGEMVRLGLAFGIPSAQRMLGELMTAQSVGDADGRLQGLTAQSLALLALGRTAEALAQFDSAGRSARGSDREEMRLQAVQWAVGLPALGFPGVPDEQRRAARTTLVAITEKEPARARAWWILLLDALDTGDTATAQTALAHMAQSPFLSRLSDALLLAARGDTSGALDVADSLRRFVDTHNEIADPLVRVALFLNRGRWLRGQHQPAAADSAWRWYQNVDWAGNWLSGPPKPAEMDWAFETYARYLRAELAHGSGDTALVCAVGPDAAKRWESADSAYKPLRDSLIAWTAGCGPS